MGLGTVFQGLAAAMGGAAPQIQNNMALEQRQAEQDDINAYRQQGLDDTREWRAAQTLRDTERDRMTERYQQGQRAHQRRQGMNEKNRLRIQGITATTAMNRELRMGREFEADLARDADDVQRRATDDILITTQRAIMNEPHRAEQILSTFPGGRSRYEQLLRERTNTTMPGVGSGVLRNQPPHQPSMYQLQGMYAPTERREVTGGQVMSPAAGGALDVRQMIEEEMRARGPG